MFRNSRKCCCMNNSFQNSNSCNAENEMMETSCQNVASYSQSDGNACDCGFEEELSLFPENPMLAQSYVPLQFMDRTFRPNVGLKMGTLFPELVSPYVPCQSMEENKFIRETNMIGKGCNQCQ